MSWIPHSSSECWFWGGLGGLGVQTGDGSKRRRGVCACGVAWRGGVRGAWALLEV